MNKKYPEASFIFNARDVNPRPSTCKTMLCTPISIAIFNDHSDLPRTHFARAKLSNLAEEDRDLNAQEHQITSRQAVIARETTELKTKPDLHHHCLPTKRRGRVELASTILDKEGSLAHYTGTASGVACFQYGRRPSQTVAFDSIVPETPDILHLKIPKDTRSAA